MILGVSGFNGAGKGEIVRFLEARSFYPLSLSDVIRDELRAKGLEETRERMIETGRALRAAHGPGGLAERLASRLLPDRNYVIDSVRHPAEVEVLRARTGRFRLLWVDADESVRLARIRARGRHGDPKTLEELRAFEARELANEDPAGQQLLAVQRLADFTLRNDGELPALHEAIQDVLERSFFFERPSWDEYFMAIARVVASRSNCIKRKVAAVITRRPPPDLDRLQRHPPRRAQLQRRRLPPLQLLRARRHPPRRMPVQPRRGERHHPGRLPRRLRPRLAPSTPPSVPA